MSYLAFIQQALQQTSRLCQEQFGKVSGSVKPDDPNQVLTETDLAVGKFLVSHIQQRYPDHNIIDEEAGVIDRGSPYTWVVDPIDGTSNFAQGIPTYGTYIGVLHENQPLAGGIALPAFHDILVAERGQGAYRGDARVHVTDIPTLRDVLVAYGIDSHPNSPEQTRHEVATMARIIDACRNLRTSNSAFDAVLVADGRYGATLNQNSKIWDNVAQHVIIEEAGGVYTDFLGQPLDYIRAVEQPERNYTWCAAAPTLHQQLQKLIHAS